MSLLPMMFRHLRPSSWMEQQLKLMQQMDAIMSAHRPVYRIEWPEYFTDLDPSIKNQRGPFKIQLDLKHFKPENITVKTVNGEVIVEGREESKDDAEKGFISRHFVRTYSLPDGHNSENVVSSLSKEGILTIMAPEDKNPDVERIIPIEMKDEKVEKKDS